VQVRRRRENAGSSDGRAEPILLADIAPGQRNRRPVDAALLLCAILVLGWSAAIAASDARVDKRVADALHTILGWAVAPWRVLFVAALVVAAGIVVDVLIHRRWVLARDLVAGLGLVAAVVTVLGRLVESRWPTPEDGWRSTWGFPEIRLAAVAVVVVVAGPEMARFARVFADWLIVLAAVGVVALGYALPAHAFGALAVGIACGAVVRLCFGTAAGVPPVQRVSYQLAELGVEATDVRVWSQQRMGTAEYGAADDEGKPLRVRLLGRDAQDTQRLARRWRSLAYRDPPRSVADGRLEQVEHEALAALMAAQAGVRVPGVVIAALGAEGDALLVTRQPDREPLEASLASLVADSTLDDLWHQVGRLHDAGISHGRLNASNIVVVDGAATILDLSAATLGAPQSAIDIDVAELLVACTVMVGPERALRAAIDGVGTDAVAGALPYLQRSALTPHGRDLARHSDVALKELRAAAASATNQEEPPELASISRVTWKGILTTGLVGVAGYLLIKQLGEIGFGTIADELRTASISWVVLGVVLAQITLISDAVSLRGAVKTPLPLLPCVALESAVKFVSLTVPGSAARTAMNVRFLQRMGAPTPEAVAAAAVDGVSETVIQTLLVALLLPFVDLKVDTSQLGHGGPDPQMVGLVLGALVAGVIVSLTVPRLRAMVVPGVRSALGSLWTVARSRRKRVELFGANLATQVLFALTLGAACQAYGVDLSLAQLLLVNMAASALSSLVPVPGGIGAAEAGITAGLVAVGVDQDTALAIAITHRLCTYFLPPLWGYFALRWLQQKAYV